MTQAHVDLPAPRPKIAPLAPERFALQLTIARSTCEKLEYAKALLGHRIPSGDLEQVLDRALDALITKLEKQRFAATSRPGSRRRASSNPRHIPAHVKRQVWNRDGGRCSFVSANGQRCNSRTRLEFDHMEPVVRGGRATCKNLRLLCRAHNQHMAECEFGACFMGYKRREAKKYAEPPQRSCNQDVVPWLRRLGMSAAEARRAAARCGTIPNASLEQRVRLALSRPGSSSRPCHQDVTRG